MKNIRCQDSAGSLIGIIDLFLNKSMADCIVISKLRENCKL